MTRLPTPGGDDGTWGDILNQYLLKSHTSDGSLKSGSVTGGTIANGSVSETKLDAALQTKINAAGSGSGAVSSVNGQTGDVTLTKADVGLGNVNNTSDANKPISTATQAALDLKMDATQAFALSDLTDIDATVDSATTGQVLKFDGSKWGPGADALGGGSGDPTMGGDLSGTASNAQIIAGAVDTPELADSAVTDAKVAAGAAIAQSKIANLTTDLAAKIDSSEKGVASGVASLDGTGKVPSSQLPAAAGTPDATTTSKGVVQLAGDLGGTAAAPTVPGLAGKEDSSNKGVAGGYASLDGTGKVPSSQLPAAAGMPDATTTSKGVVQLAGDLGGTAASPTVPGLAAKADDSSVAHLAGSETLTGAKDFTGGLTVNGTGVVVTSDSRLADERTPLDGSVTEPKISASNSPGANQVLSFDGTNLAWTDNGGDMTGYVQGDGIAKVTVGPTAPTGPAVGDVWIATS